MTDHLTENARLRAALEAMLHRHILYCGGESMAFAGHTDVALFQEARTALATPAPDAVQEVAIDIAAIESGGKRWHGEDHRVVSVRWEPYKPDGQRQMKAKGRWQEQVGIGDYWRWQNCARPSALATPAPDAPCCRPQDITDQELQEFGIMDRIIPVGGLGPKQEPIKRHAPDAVQEAGAEYAAGFAEGIRRAAELPAYDCDGDPCGAFDNPIFVKRDAILALTPSSQEASHDRT